jgi:hypothetical protein
MYRYLLIKKKKIYFLLKLLITLLYRDGIPYAQISDSQMQYIILHLSLYFTDNYNHGLNTELGKTIFIYSGYLRNS